MAIFESTEKMYEVLGSLFNTLMSDPTMGPKFKTSNIVIQFIISEPEGQIWLTSEGEVICGSPAEEIKPTIQMTLSGDSCHAFWLQKLSMPIALAKGKIKAKGPMPKVLKLLPLLKPAYKAYPDIAREHGLAV